MPAWVVVSGVVWTAVPALPVRATAWTRAEFGGDAPPGRPGAAFGDADEQQRQPADQDVGADAVLEPVEDGA